MTSPSTHVLHDHAFRDRPRSTPVSKPNVPYGGHRERRRRIAFGALLLAVSGSAAAIVLSDGAGGLPRSRFGLFAHTAEGTLDAPAFLARSTLMALNDANRTGNYGVLHALAAPDFQAANSAEALAGIFEGLRREGVDLSMAAVAPPSWEAPSAIGPDRLLRLRGAYRTGRHAVRFVLAYAAVANDWRLIEISVAAEPARE